MYKIKKRIFQESNLDRLGRLEDIIINQMEQELQHTLDMSCTIEKDIINGRLIVKTMRLNEHINWLAKNIHLVIKELAEKHGLETPIVNSVITSQFKFMKDTFEGGSFTGYQAIYLGKFVPTDKRRAKYLNKLIAALTNIVTGEKKEYVARI